MQFLLHFDATDKLHFKSFINETSFKKFNFLRNKFLSSVLTFTVVILIIKAAKITTSIGITFTLCRFKTCRWHQKFLLSSRHTQNLNREPSQDEFLTIGKFLVWGIVEHCFIKRIRYAFRCNCIKLLTIPTKPYLLIHTDINSFYKIKSIKLF